MNRGTLESIEATIVCFVLDSLDRNYCTVDDSRYVESTDTCKITIHLDDGYRVDVNAFEKKITFNSNHTLLVKPLIAGEQFELIVFNCRRYFSSSNQIILDHKRNTKIFMMAFILILIVLWTIHTYL